jgi:hypothetical protein
MAVYTQYLQYLGGAIKRTARERKRYLDVWLLPSGVYSGSYTDNTVVASGSFQHTIDYISLWWDAKRLDRKMNLKRPNKFINRFDYGSPFYSRTITNTLPPTLSVQRVNSSGGVLDSWTGFAWPHGDARSLSLALANKTVPTGTGDTDVPDSLLLNGFGARGIAETLPSVPSVSISQTIGELREGLPSLMHAGIASGNANTLGDALSGTGDSYINYVFGIQPLISDLGNYIKTTKNYEHYSEQFARNAGKTIRRNRTLAETTNSVTTNLTNGPPTPSEGGARHWFSGARSLVTESKVKVWFSADYKVAPPKMDRNQFDSIKDWLSTYGADPTLLTAWNLTPWSWLSDWVVSYDDLLTNVSYLGKRGVSLHYAYVMCTTEITKRWTYDGQYRPTYNSAIPGGGPTVPVSLTAEQTTVTKQRVKASPLGFGVVGKDLTDNQKAILTALGLSRFF